MKTCTKCGETKPLDCFHKDSTKAGGHRHDCKTCVCQRRAEYVAANKARVAAADSEYKKRNRSKYNEINKQTYYRNRHKVLNRQRAYYQKVKDRKSEYAKMYYQDNKHDYTLRVAKRRAAALRATPAWADDAIIRFMYATRQYLTQDTGEDWHVDHIVPLQGRNVCGLHVHFNLRVVPAKVNLSKSNKF